MFVFGVDVRVFVWYVCVLVCVNCLYVCVCVCVEEIVCECVNVDCSYVWLFLV